MTGLEIHIQKVKSFHDILMSIKKVTDFALQNIDKEDRVIKELNNLYIKMLQYNVFFTPDNIALFNYKLRRIDHPVISYLSRIITAEQCLEVLKKLTEEQKL